MKGLDFETIFSVKAHEKQIIVLNMKNENKIIVNLNYYQYDFKDNYFHIWANGIDTKIYYSAIKSVY